MNPSELFDVWAPPAAVWSRWAKPVLFAEIGFLPSVGEPDAALAALKVRSNQQTAVVVDLPGAESVQTGLALIRCGFRPVPLFNGALGPWNALGAALVDNSLIVAWLVAGAGVLGGKSLPLEAPPAFLLDARRQSASVSPSPGRFDNRWVVFPQDFPSANFLKAHAIARVLLLQSRVRGLPEEDLTHVLLRWQEAGLEILTAEPAAFDRPEPLVVRRPSWFRALFYQALTVAGLRRNSAGGFGSIIPQPSSG